MNETANKILLVGDKFMPEMHLKQLGFTKSDCGPFTKNKERIEKFMQTGNTDFIYKNKLDKACFQNDMAYDKKKDLVKTTQSDKVLKNKAFKIASDLKYDGYQRGLALNGLIVEVVLLMNQIINWQMNFINQLLENFKKEVYTSFKDNIWGVDLADMQSLSKYNKGNKYLLCATDLFSKYVWLVPIKDKKGTSICNAFQKIISEGRKPNKIWVDQGSEFYNNFFKEFNIQ